MIRVPELRVVGEDGQQLGVLPTARALEMAREAGLDLVEVAPTAVPPVCRILDYGRFKYEQAKKEQEAKKHQHHAEVREVRFKVKIDEHDIAFKTRRAEGFLRDGDKVKVSVMFRGREITHPELGRNILVRVAEELKPVSQVEHEPTMEGRFMNMILTPAKHVRARERREGEQRQQPPPETEAGPGPQPAAALRQGEGSSP